MITLYVIPSQQINSHKQATIDSCSYLNPTVVCLERYEDFFKEKPETPWVMFLFDNERLSPELCYAIEVFLQYPDLDFLIVLKKIEGNPPKFYTCMRIFQKSVELHPNYIKPKNEFGKFNYERILNGWVLEHND